MPLRSRWAPGWLRRRGRVGSSCGTVDELLAGGVGVDGRHHRPLHPDVAVGDLDDRRDAVGGAAGARNDLWFTVGVVHAMHHGGHGLRRRRRGQDHVRGTGLNVLLQAVLAGEHAGAFQHQVDAEVGPRQVRRVAFGERRDPPAVDQQCPVRGGDRTRVAAVDGVVFEEVGQVVDVGDVVDRDEVEPVGVQQDLQRRPADAAQPVDGHVRHLTPPSCRVPRPRGRRRAATGEGRRAGSRHGGSTPPRPGCRSARSP